jgi:hypothetical protein
LNVSFAGPISSEVEGDIRALYERHLPWTRELLLLLGVAVLANIWFPDQTATYIFRIPLAKQVPLSPVDKLLFLALAAVFFWFAFGLPHVWWRWWWPKIEQSFGDTLSGQVSEDGVRWCSQPEIIPWRRFITAKLGERSVLLYLTKAYPLPFHRSMFKDSVDWLDFRGLVVESKVRIYRFT